MFSLGAAAAPSGGGVSKAREDVFRIHVVAWKARPFVRVAHDNPELAACLSRAPGVWARISVPTVLPTEEELGRALPEHLTGLLPEDGGGELTIFVGAIERTVPAAVVYGQTALLLLPKSEVVGVGGISGVLAAALVASRLTPAGPDPRCGEPLLALGEALARAGTLSLAALPPELRPVKGWIEESEVATLLSTLVRSALDKEVGWETRRAKLQGLGQLGGGSPQLSHAAALLVETYGDAQRALAKPYDFLRAWAERTDKAFPRPPRALKKAVDEPLTAGFPGKKQQPDKVTIANQAIERAVLAGSSVLPELPANAPLTLRQLAAARARGRGAPALCQWLLASSPVPSPMRTGCRSEGEEGGIVFSRPRPGSGADVVWRGSAGEESLLFSWPRLLLFPRVLSTRGELWFIDAEGLWRASLDAREAPHRVLAGAFRRLAASPDGAHLATTRHADGRVVVVSVDGEERELDGVATGGLGWLDRDVLVVSDGKQLSLMSLSGEKREGVATTECGSSVVASGGTVFVGVTAPCQPGIVRIDLGTGQAEGVVRLSDGAAELALFPDGSVVFSSADGIWRWRGGGQGERLTAGLTPGPG
jgi:hypothetical protein